MYNQVKPRQGPARGPPHRNEVPKWDPTQEGRCQARPEPHPLPRCGGLGWIPGATVLGFPVAQLSPPCVPGACAPAAPVPHLHLLRRQQIFIEHVRLAPETQQGGEGGPGGVPSPSSCSRGAPVPAEEAETKTSTGAEKRNGPRRCWARTLPPAGPRAGAEDRAPPRTGRRIGPRPGRPGGGGGGGSRRVAARGAGCSETPS